MMERHVVENFLNKRVKVVREDNKRDICNTGIIKDVTDTALILDYYGSIQAISLDSLKNIREEDGE